MPKGHCERYLVPHVVLHGGETPVEPAVGAHLLNREALDRLGAAEAGLVAKTRGNVGGISHLSEEHPFANTPAEADWGVVMINGVPCSTSTGRPFSQS